MLKFIQFTKWVCICLPEKTGECLVCTHAVTPTYTIFSKLKIIASKITVTVTLLIIVPLACKEVVKI